MNFTLNYSPNFQTPKRNAKQIKFIIFHYTGMKKDSEAIARLTDIKSKVSCHYLIKKDGEIIMMVPDLYSAWHAGKSRWKKNDSLNKNSIGIEICNPGHEFNYKKFSNRQILSLIKLSKFLTKKYKIKPKNILGHSDIAPDRKKDPGEKFPWEYLAKKKIGIWHGLDIKILKQLRKEKLSKIDQNSFLENIYKIGYPKKTSKILNKNKYNIMITKAFQRRYRPSLVNGKSDQECLLISQDLLKSLH